MNHEKKRSMTSQLKKPEWLKVNLLPSSDNYKDLKKEMRQGGLATVCEEAKCPNINECWQARTATIMILGDTCTRACKFCHVNTGNPKGFINPEEIEQTSRLASLMNLKYLVLTSVDRDDLPDHGSGHFAAVVKRLKQDHPELMVEVLIPDFDGIPEHMDTLAQSQPLVIAQNIETVERLTHPVRDRRSGYKKTLDALAYYKKNYSHISTKSSLMLGLGESDEEIYQALQDLRSHQVDIVTMGQYLRPTMRHLKVEKYYHPDEFEAWKAKAYELGFSFVASGPLVRSSYKAAEFLDHMEKKNVSL